MLVMGADPGVIETGLSVWRSHPAVARVMGVSGSDHEALVRAMIDFGERALSAEPASLRELVLAIEDQRHVQRGKTERGESSFAASAVRDIQMILAGAAIARGWPVVLIAPASAKLAATGNGRATKEQVRKFVELRLRVGRLSQNQADSVAVAMAGWPAYDRLVRARAPRRACG